MNIDQISRKKRTALLNYSGKDSPHLMIESNLSCNIRCRCCYNINNTYVKSFGQICEEVDLGMQKRNLQSITLIGGEPTLHPHLARIIEFIKSKKMKRRIFCYRKYACYQYFDGILALSALRIHTVVIQNPPEYHPEKKQFHICYHCPDATIRNGMLTPLCLADMINPLSQSHEEMKPVPADVYRTVYEHMEEIN